VVRAALHPSVNKDGRARYSRRDAERTVAHMSGTVTGTIPSSSSGRIS
jgi:hypothetical protein